MLKIKLKRYYGDVNTTRSHVEIYADDTLLMECEARELGYRDYEEHRGQLYVRDKCIQRGTFGLTFTSAIGNPVALRLAGVIHHRGCLMYPSDHEQRKINTILLGYADSSITESCRPLIRISECRTRFQQILYAHFKEPAEIEVTNENVIVGYDAEGTIGYHYDPMTK